MIGEPAPRVEDERLLRGEGRFVANLRVDGGGEVAFLRSAAGHARILAVDTAEARAMPGVLAVVTAADLAGLGIPPDFLPAVATRVPEAIARQWEVRTQQQPAPLLASDRVLHVGQPIAAVIAADRALAEDAAERIRVELEELPVVVDARAALQAEPLHPGWTDNVAASIVARHRRPEAAPPTGDEVVVELEVRYPRQAAAPVEARGVVAVPTPDGGGVTVYSSTQIPHSLRDAIAAALPGARVTVRGVDVGGSFGLKGIASAEEVLVPALAHRLGRPLRWIEDRAENLAGSRHGRDQHHAMRVTGTRDGAITRLEDRIVLNAGSHNLGGLVLPMNTLSHLLGPYAVPDVELSFTAAVTNTLPVTPMRGAGRPEATLAMECAIEAFARATGLDPVEVRRRNLIPPERIPYRTGLLYRDGTDQVYDAGDFPALLDRLVAVAQERAELAPAEPGLPTGIGYALFVEGTGIGPFELAAATLDDDGVVRLDTASQSQGQSHETTLAQIAAAALSLPLDRVALRPADSDALASGFGSAASRTAVATGSAVDEACRALAGLLRLAAAHALGVPEDRVVMDPVAAELACRDDPCRRIGLAELAAHVSPWNPGRPPGMPPRLRAESSVDIPAVTYAAGGHAIRVQVDPVTGRIRVLDAVVVDDCGTVVNPLVVDGQLIGGTVQGISGMLYEEVRYASDGALLTTGLDGYLIAMTADAFPVHVEHLSTPSPLNRLGIKGVGESGVISSPAALCAAVGDALGVAVAAGPLTPDVVRALARRR